MAASFPTSIKSFSTWVDGVNYPTAAMFNQLQEETVALETMLGVNGISWIGEGQMYNGKLSVTVVSNDLVVAIKTMAGTAPSTTDPVYVRINGTIRKITAALSVTKADGTNWFNSGSAELAAKEVDYFAYLIWNTTPATDIVDIGFARRPYFSVYSDVTNTSTSDNYLAFGNASTPTSTDDMTVIGRFAATLSASGAAHIWTVPTYTTSNLIQRPIFETRILFWTPTWTNLTIGNATVNAEYQIIGRRVVFSNVLVFGSTSSISGSVSHTLPITRGTQYGGTNHFCPNVRIIDTGTATFTGFSSMTTTALTVLVGTASGTYTTNSFLSSTVPMTWTTSDELAEDVNYWI